MAKRSDAASDWLCSRARTLKNQETAKSGIVQAPRRRLALAASSDADECSLCGALRTPSIASAVVACKHGCQMIVKFLISHFPFFSPWWERRLVPGRKPASPFGWTASSSDGIRSRVDVPCSLAAKMLSILIGNSWTMHHFVTDLQKKLVFFYKTFFK